MVHPSDQILVQSFKIPVALVLFRALTCSIVGLSRKVTTLVASIYFYGHHLSSVQFMGLVICVGAMVSSFFGKKGKKGGSGGGHGGHDQAPADTQCEVAAEDEERRSMLSSGGYSDSAEVEMGRLSK